MQKSCVKAYTHSCLIIQSTYVHPPHPPPPVYLPTPPLLLNQVSSVCICVVVYVQYLPTDDQDDDGQHFREGGDEMV